MRLRYNTFLLLLLAPAGYAQTTIQTYTVKAEFLAATGATSATGPLPNLGCVASGGVGSGTVGSITFRPGPGTDVCIGAPAVPDWYPPTPGHDIAQSIEHLIVDTAAPVFSLGFDFVEPRTTMPPWGGTPVNSMYQVTLYNGATVVGQFNFDAPDDIVAFAGVHSSQAFNRAVIVDSTDNNDDEYFGVFYTGTTPAPQRMFTVAARSGGAIPGGAGVFGSFPQSPAASAARVGFLGLGTAGQQGIFTCDNRIPGDPCGPVADRTTAIPGGSGVFTGFSDLVFGRGRAAFLGSGNSGQQGVYSCIVTGPGDPCRPLADRSAAIPGGTGMFTGFSQPAMSGTVAAFIGTGTGQTGVYTCDSAIPTDPCKPVVNTIAAIPRGTGAFSSFDDVALIADRVAFVGRGAGQQGVYACGVLAPTDPCRPLADLSTVIPDGSGAFTGFGGIAAAFDSASPMRVAFIGTGAGQQGAYSCDAAIPGDPCLRIADTKTPIPQGTGAFTGFNAISASGGHVAFLGTGSGGQAGIYLASAIGKVIATGDPLDGKIVAALRLGQFGLDGESLSFGATFTDGSQGIYTFSAPSAPAAVPFASFHPVAAVDVRNGAFAAAASFTLGAGSNGISPVNDVVKLQVGTFIATIPNGSFRPNGFGGFHFRGTANGANLVAGLQPLGGSRWAYSVAGWNANLGGTVNPVTVGIAIGADTGSAAIHAFFGFVPRGF